MLNSFTLGGVFMFIVALLSLGLQWKHYMAALLMLEFMALSSFVFLFMYFAESWNSPTILYFTAIIVCSSVTSISVMLSYVRVSSNKMGSVNFLIKC